MEARVMRLVYIMLVAVCVRNQIWWNSIIEAQESSGENTQANLTDIKHKVDHNSVHFADVALNFDAILAESVITHSKCHTIVRLWHKTFAVCTISINGRFLINNLKKSNSDNT